MRLSKPLALAALAALAGAAATAGLAARDRGADRIPIAIPDGPPRRCVPIVQLRDSQVRSDRVIDFRTTGRRGWRVTLPQPCPELGFERRFAYETSLGELCSTDVVTVLHDAPLGRGTSCGLGPFQPVVFPHR